MSRNEKRQLFTTVFLLLFIVGCVGAGIYLRKTNSTEETETSQMTTRLSQAVIQADRELALKRYQDDTAQEPAQVLTRLNNSTTLKAGLMFYGVCSQKTEEEILSALEQANLNAALFLTAEQAAENQQMVCHFIDAGHEVGVLNDSAATSPTAMVEKLALAGTAIQSYSGVQPTSILMLEPVDGELPYAAAAAFYEQIYEASQTIDPNRITTQAAADELVSGLYRGQLLAVKLTDSSTAQGVAYLCTAIDAANLNRQTSLLLSQSDAQPEEAVKSIYTIQRAVSFTFSGMGTREELDGVLDALSNVQGRGIFFLSREDLETYPQQAQLILDQGHTLGLLAPNTGTAEEILEQLLAGEEILRHQLGITGDIPAQSDAGNPGEALLTAAQAGGYPLLSYDLLATRQEDARQTDALAVLEDLLPAQKGFLRRGEIVHFYLGLYQNSDSMLADLVYTMATQRNLYDICPAMEILSSTDSLYVYPVPEEEILPEVKDKIYPGQLDDADIETLSSRYIGADWVDRASVLPGFTNNEIGQIDTKGTIPNAGNRIFLTFDDWGTDETLTKLLDVLAKHDAKATFFVRTNFIAGNPNLLRAIAAEGHAIGSHTNSHFPLSNSTESATRYTSLTQEQVADLQEDLVTSYRALQSIVGDMQVDGQSPLCRIFRPPTLAMSREGLEAVLDCGFTYIVSGSYSTQDYNAKSAQELFNRLKSNTKDGAVFIMHMSDHSIYTAEAVDLYLTYLETHPRGYQACRLTDVLEG